LGINSLSVVSDVNSRHDDIFTVTAVFASCRENN